MTPALLALLTKAFRAGGIQGPGAPSLAEFLEQLDIGDVISAVAETEEILDRRQEGSEYCDIHIHSELQVDGMPYLVTRMERSSDSQTSEVALELRSKSDYMRAMRVDTANIQDPPRVPHQEKVYTLGQDRPVPQDRTQSRDR